MEGQLGAHAVTAAMVARSRGLSGPRFSPDGRLLAWIETVAGRSDIVVAPTDASSPPVVVTADAAAAPFAGFTWAGDTPRGSGGVPQIVYAAPDGRLLAVPASGGPLRILSPDGQAAAPAATPDGERIAFVLERDDRCDIAVVPTDGSTWPARLSTGADWAFDPAWAPDGRSLAWHEWDFPAMPWDASRIVIRAVEGLRPGGAARVVAGGAGDTGGQVACGQPRFSPGGDALAFVCDRTGWMNVWVADPAGAGGRPLLDEPHEHAEPTWGAGQRSWAWAPDGSAIALCRNEGGFGRLVVAPMAGDPRPVGKGWHHFLDWGEAGIAAIRSGGVTPPSVVIADAVTSGARRVLASGAPGALVAAGPVEPEPVSWTGEDGGTVHGLLYRPATSALGPGKAPPLIVYVHGGPTGSSAVTWWPRHQFWVSRGWAVLAPNYRGSTGYGRAYTQALAGCWGDLDVSDVAAGIRHAGASGWCDPGRVAIDGGSAGGFTLLLLCARYPGLVRAAVDRYGVADLFDLAETTHRYESRYLDQIVGPLPQAAALYRERSPVTHAAKITVPLLVLQGDRDNTVPKAQADALVDALRRQGSAVEYHVYEGEGHGWSKPDTVADELERSEKFLTRWVLRR
ncbi:MAG TPA: S9 family peptidase [Acidimicrobiia bacterium]|nr:S9 family peptidase [Acidimicrobiia bacterium]